MSSQWNTKGIDQNIGALAGGLLDEAVVLLLQGKNTFGDRIYTYLKLTVKDVMRMRAALSSGEAFNPSDYGSVVAAGKGEPTDEVKAEIASMYKVLDGEGSDASGGATAAPPAQKAWDEY